VFQGESPRAQDNEFLGTLKLSGLPKGPKGSVRLEISFELSNEGLLKLKAREGASGAEVETVLATRDTPETVRAGLASDAGGAPPEGSEAAQAPAPQAAAESAPEKKKGGFFGWLNRVFGRP
jgi:molecular chaperone DnaK